MYYDYKMYEIFCFQLLLKKKREFKVLIVISIWHKITE